MLIKVDQVRLDLDQDENRLPTRIAAKLHVSPAAIKSWRVVRRALDARKKHPIAFVYTIEVDLPVNLTQKALALPGVERVQIPESQPLRRGERSLRRPPVVIGAGPAGLFAAWLLARYGYRPLLVERGAPVEVRAARVETFWRTGKLDFESNVQFGEGGAGTFADGKLTTRIKDGRVQAVLAALVKCGAPESILIDQKPHLGTDLLRRIVVNLRRRLKAAGCRVAYYNRLTGLRWEGNQLAAVELNSSLEFAASVAVLAVGHSARDTYAVLQRAGVCLEPKPFAVGLRVEHPQVLIDQAQYGEHAGHPRLGAADYHLTYHSETLGRNAYTFCMCPGGQVVAGASEAGGVVTNGMSYQSRDSDLANSAVVVSVTPADFPHDGPLGGVEFQRQWERMAYCLGGRSFWAPVQSAPDFIADAVTGEPPLAPSYRPGVAVANLRECLPKEVGQALAEALLEFDRKIPGFAADNATLTGVETRTSAPVRLVRDATCQAIGWQGIYPAGEGAGYAGGIVSAAVDGLKVAESIIKSYAPAREDFDDDVLAALQLSPVVRGRKFD